MTESHIVEPEPPGTSAGMGQFPKPRPSTEGRKPKTKRSLIRWRKNRRKDATERPATD